MGFQELQAQPPPTLMFMVLPVTTLTFNSKVRFFSSGPIIVYVSSTNKVTPFRSCH
jgi:hypothetical protein